MRLFPDYQGNLRERLYEFTQARIPSDGNVYQLLSQMMDTTITSMDTSLQTFRQILSTTPQDNITAMTQAQVDAVYWQTIEQMRGAISTGFPALDRVIGGGVRPGRLWITLGAPGSGKTTFVNQLCEHVAHSGRPVVYLSCEEQLHSLYAKTLARLGSVDYEAVQYGRQAYRNRIENARRLANQRGSAMRLLYLEGTGTDLAYLEEIARAHFRRYADEGSGGGPGILVVDYLQCVAQSMIRNGSGTFRDENQLISMLTYDLRALAKKLNCTVIALSSQSRASGYGNANALTSGKGSGGIEYGTDVLMSLDVDKDEERVVPPGMEPRVLLLPKNRLGPPNTPILLNWQGIYQRFIAIRGGSEEGNDDE